MAEIKNDCPFCGASPQSLHIWGDSTIGGFYRWVVCGECQAQGPRAASRANDQDQRATDAAAIEKWNDQWALQYTPFNQASQ